MVFGAGKKKLSELVAKIPPIQPMGSATGIFERSTVLPKFEEFAFGKKKRKF